MSAPSKCVFSQGGDIVTKKRNRLTEDSIRMIVCFKAWGIFTKRTMMRIMMMKTLNFKITLICICIFNGIEFKQEDT